MIETSHCAAAGFFFGNTVKKLLGNTIKTVGGLILIGIGMRILIEHMS